MSMIIWGGMVAGVLTLNLAAYEKEPARFVDAVGLSAFVFFFWVLTNVGDATVPFPQNKTLHPMIDLAGGMLAMRLWWEKREPQEKRKPWKLVIAGLFLAQSVLDSAFWLAWWHHPLPWIGTNYVLWLNVLFTAILVILGWSGGLSVASDLLDMLPDRPRLVHNRGARSGRGR